jgi:hypothetical protein
MWQCYSSMACRYCKLMSSAAIEQIRRAFVAGLLLACLAVGLPGQVVLDIPRDLACESCRIELRHVANIVDPADANTPPEVFSIARDSRGRMFVAPMLGNATVGVYSRSGRLLRELGRAGGGPGEFRMAETVKVLPGDTVVVIDPAARRVTVYSPELELLRTYPVDFMPRGVVMRNSGSFIGFSPAQQGPIVHFVSADGASRRSVIDAEIPPGEPVAFFRIFSAGRNGTIWLGRTNRYLVQQYDSTGSLLRTIRSAPDWHEPWTEVPSQGPDVLRPVPFLRAIREDADGLLWLVFHVPQTDWSPRRAPSRAEPRHGMPMTEWNQYVDTLIEVIDPRSGRLLATRRFDPIINSYLTTGDNLYEARHETPSLHVRVSVWEMSLSGYTRD